MTDLAQSASALVSFSFQSSFNVRVVTVDGEPWFVGKDVALALGYVDTKQAIRDNCKRAKSLKDLGASARHPKENQALDPQTKLIPEPDVYRLITRSKLPSAEAFETWLFETVLPSIRKTGGYQIPANPVETLTAQQYDELARALRLTAWLFQGAGTQTAVHDHLRTVLNVRHLKDIPAAQFPLAMQVAKDIHARAGHVLTFMTDLLDDLVRDYIAAGSPCTLVLARQYKQRFKVGVPAYPNWIEIQRTLSLPASTQENQA